MCDCILQDNHAQFVLQTHKTDPGFWGAWPVLRDLKSEYIQDSRVHNQKKFRGAQIDIFGLDRGINMRLHKYLGLLSHYLFIVYEIGVKSKFCASVAYFLIFNIIHPLVRKSFFLLGKKSSLSYALGTTWNAEYDYCDLFPSRPIAFEGLYFQGPADPDASLRKEYGDYMKLPPIDKRDCHHAKYRVWD